MKTHHQKINQNSIFLWGSLIIPLLIIGTIIWVLDLPLRGYQFVPQPLDSCGTYTGMVAYDLDGDGTDEIISTSYSSNPRGFIACYDQKAKRYGEIIRLPVQKVYLLDIYKNPATDQDEIWVTWIEDSAYVIAAYTLPDFTLRKQSTFDYPILDHFPLRVKGDDLLPYNLFFFNHGGEIPDPRRLFAVDAVTLEQVWKFDLASPVDVSNGVNSIITSSGDTLIAFGTSSPDNHIKVGEWSDEHSYFYMLDINGRLVDCQELGDRHSTVSMALLDVDNDGWDEIVTVRSAACDTSSEYSSVWIWRSWRNPPLRAEKTVLGGFNTLIPYDFNVDGTMDLITVKDAESFAVISFDEMISYEKKDEIISHDTRLIDLVDVLNNGEEWLIVTDGNARKRIVYDLRFNQVAEMSLDKLPLHVFLRGPSGHAKKAAGFSGGSIFILNLKYLINWRLVIWALFLPLAIWLVIMALPFSERIRLIRGLRMYPTAIISRRGKLTWTSTEWEDHFIDGLPSEVSRDLAKVYYSNKPVKQTFRLEKDQQMVDYEITSIPYRNIFLGRCGLVVARDVSDAIKDPVVKKLLGKTRSDLHRIKGQLSAIQYHCSETISDLGKSPIESPENVPLRLYKISEITDRVLQSCKWLLDLLDNWQIDRKSVQVRSFFDDCITRYAENFGREGLAFEVEIKDDAIVEMNQLSVQECIDNLLDNAVNAMTSSGTIRVTGERVRIYQMDSQHNSERYHLKISDEGVGMLPEQVKSVNESAQVRTKAGSGFGINDAKKVMADHDGTLFYESEQGIGTVVTLEFRIAGI